MMKLQSASVQRLARTLSDQLIPWATTGTGFVFLDVPPNVVGSNQVTERPGKVLFKKNAVRYGSPVISWHWYEENLNSISVPYLGCVVDGEADIMLGTTSEMCRKLKVPGKRWIIQMPQKSFFFLPPGTPISAGKGPHWLRPNPETAFSRMFWAHVHDNGCECHFSTTRDGKLWSQPHIFVPSDRVSSLSQHILDEMTNRPFDHVATTYLQLSLLFRYLRRSLEQGLMRTPTDNATLTDSLVPPMSSELQLQRAIDHIDANLSRSSLTAEKIAMHTRLSVSQLNRHFHRQFQMSLMRFVWNRRLEHSREMLLHSSHNVMQIGYRCGFAHTSSFVQAFIRKYGMSPTTYRHQNTAVNKEPNE